jgi:hypothetical protein
MTEREPLVVLGPLQAFLDDRALGAGAGSARPIGAGPSYLTYQITPREDRFGRRRPPPAPLPRARPTRCARVTPSARWQCVTA